jgi:prepilin-type N-terminal cleavage/methylation domain-containing protein
MWKLLRQGLRMKWVFKKNLSVGRRAFSLIEVSVALVIVGMIAASVLVIINRAVDTVVDWQTKMEAFEIARENMEKLLAQSSLSDMVKYGVSEKNPDIKWETTVESFYEPVSDRMWMRAVCTAQFPGSSGEEQKIELTHWLTSLSKEQIQQILEWQYQQEQWALSQETNEQSQGQLEQQPQEQPQTEQDQPVDESQAWKELEKTMGPPPEGYENWGQVPQEQLLKAVMEKAVKK